MAQETPQILWIELREIEVKGGSIRSGDWTQGRTTEIDEGHSCHELSSSFHALAESIKHMGQLEPVIVRENHSDSRKRWELITGYRRYAALRLLWERDDIRRPILAIVRETRDSFRAATELASNCREHISAPDMAFALERYANEMHADGQEVSDTVLAKHAGIDVPFAYTLLRIVRGAPLVAKHWREAPIRLSLVNMNDIARLDADKQLEAYEKMVSGEYDSADEVKSRLEGIADKLQELVEALRDEDDRQGVKE